jgi:magnesium transporter
MTPNYVAVRPEWTVGASMDHIRKMGRDSETVNVST